MPEPSPGTGGHAAKRSVSGLRTWFARGRQGRRPSNELDGSPAGPDPVAGRLLELIYPLGAAKGHEEALLAHLAGRPVNSLSDLRMILSSFERQLAPSPLDVRFGPSDLGEYALGDLTLYALKDDISVSQSVLAGGIYEPHVVATLTRLCRTGMNVLDIGANIGYHSFLLSQLVGGSGHVTAVEPNSENCRLMLLGILKNSIENISVLPVCLDRQPGWGYFGTHLGSNGGFLPATFETLADGRGVVVPTLRLDDLGLDRVDLLKIDVEGAEARIIEGGLSVLERDRPIVISEFSLEMLDRISDTRGEHYLSIYSGLGYAVHVIDKETGAAQPVEASELTARSRPTHQIDDLLFIPPPSA